MKLEGKAGEELLSRLTHIRGALRRDVVVWPSSGHDFGAAAVNGRVIIASTDPLYIERRIGLKFSAWLSFHSIATDVAVSGIRPSFLTVSWSLPPDATRKELLLMSETIGNEAARYNIAIIAGHTGVYPGACLPYAGAATCLGIGKKEQMKMPEHTSPGDAVIATGTCALEAAFIVSNLYREKMEEIVGRSSVQKILKSGRKLTALDAALCASKLDDVVCMHDAGERGIIQALHELSNATGMGIDVQWDMEDEQNIAWEICNALCSNPMNCSSTGVLLIVAKRNKEERVMSQMKRNGMECMIIGHMRRGKGVYINKRRSSPPEKDGMLEIIKRLERV